MKKNLTIIFVLFALLTLAACQQDEDPTPTAEAQVEETAAEEPTAEPPAAEPTEEPVAEPTAEPVEEPTEVPPTEEPAPEATEPAAEEENTASAATFGENWESVECASIDVAPTVAAVADCGIVTVPANRANGSDQMIQLQVVRVNSPSEDPGAPIFLGTGGPGSYGLGNVQTALDGSNWPVSHATMLADHDWVFFTQRGTLGANPYLTCPSVNNVPIENALENRDEDQSIQAFTEAAQECYDTITEQGINLDDYNSVESADDVNDIREALGYDQFIYYGQSYGTQLGQFVMRQHADMLEAVILDGVVPVEFTAYSQTQNFGEALQRVFAACEADEVCNANYPDLENTLIQVYDTLQESPAAVEVNLDGETQTMYINGLNALDGLSSDMYAGGANVPRLIYGLREGDPTVLSRMAPSLNTLSPNARMMNYSVNCSDDPDSSLDAFPLDSPVQAYNDYIRDDALRYAVIPCPLIDVPHLPDTSDEPIVGDLPVLVLSGALDPVTPVTHGERVAQHLPNSQHIVFPDGGHIQTEKLCAQEIIAAFTADPLAPVDTSCLAAQQTFAVPVQATTTSPEGATMTVTLPAGFNESQPSQWSSGKSIVALAPQPAGTAPEDALAAVLGPSFDASLVVDGPSVAGLPSKLFQGEMALGSTTYDYDAIAFEAPNGTFIIWPFQADSTLLERWRTISVPSILETVTIE